MTPASRRLLALCLALPLAAAAADTKIEGGGASAPLTPIASPNVQRLGALNTSLEPGAGVAPLSADAAVPSLPASALTPAQTAAAASASASAVPAQAASAAPPAPPAPIAAAAPAAPPAPPYFVGALTRLGVPEALALKLASYQTSRHPGEQREVYHGLAHSQDVPAAAAQILEGPAGASLTTRQKILLIVAAAFHDIDPARAPGTPARVSATLPYLESDRDTRALLSEFERRYGFTLAQVQTLIKATDFNPDPAGQKTIQDEFQRMADASFAPEENAWALEWGRKLSFADKSATYLGTFESADRQVLNLAAEIRKAVEAATGKTAPDRGEMMLKGSHSFLKALRDSPDYAILPAALKANFEKVLDHFQQVADGRISAAAIAAQAKPRAPPTFGQDALDSARRNAGALDSASQSPRRLPSAASDAAGQGLSQLNTAGYAVLSPGVLIDPAAERAVLDIVARDWIKDGEPVTGQLPFEDPAQPLWRARVAEIRSLMMPVVDALTARLNAVLPGENIEVRDVQLRLASTAKPEKQGMHVDLGGYMTATYALRGRGTVLYVNQGGKVQTLEAPTHAWAVITNMEREAATGKIGTVHDTPITDRDRVLLIIRFKRAGQQPLTDDERRSVAQRAKARIQGVMQGLARQGLKPGPEKKKGLLSKLFGE